MVAISNPTPLHGVFPTGRLSGRELLILQLRARGYPREQIAALLQTPTAALAQVEWSAHVALGVATVEEAVELARQRGLIV